MPEKTDAPKPNPLPPPETGGKPEKITASAPPGGMHTPGAKKAARRAERLANKTASS